MGQGREVLVTVKKEDIIDKKRNQLIIKDLEALEKEAKYTETLSKAPFYNAPP